MRKQNWKRNCICPYMTYLGTFDFINKKITFSYMWYKLKTHINR